jgi:uncharacterized protein
MLRGEIFVDLYRVVRQGLRIGVSSYSIKKLEPLYMQARQGQIVMASSSVIEYERWLQSGDQKILDDIYTDIDKINDRISLPQEKDYEEKMRQF